MADNDTGNGEEKSGVELAAELRKENEEAYRAMGEVP